jgi:CubicO group peptidase (beta-lactamase class C family)
MNVGSRFVARAVIACVAIGGALPGQGLAQARVRAIAPYQPVAQMLERFVKHERADKNIAAISVALIDGERIVWAEGFGFERVTPDSIPATAETIYRVASVSKLFTDLGAMQLAERGLVHLDTPVVRYLPSFQPRNRFGKPITLRQLMSHRSGLVREPPVGHYSDTTEPTLAATVASLNQTALVYAPESRIKY